MQILIETKVLPEIPKKAFEKYRIRHVDHLWMFKVHDQNR